MIKGWAQRHGYRFRPTVGDRAPKQPDADFHYIIYNADGSEAEQCGNGTRCVAWLAQHLGLSNKPQLSWHSKGGMLQTKLLEARSPTVIETTLPVPSLTPGDVPFIANSEANTAVLEADGRSFEVTAVSTGNPHGVIFVDKMMPLTWRPLAPQLVPMKLFPNHANIGFCQVVDRSFMRLRVYERGVGETCACGTGASAAVVATQSQFSRHR